MQDRIYDCATVPAAPPRVGCCLDVWTVPGLYSLTTSPLEQLRPREPGSLARESPLAQTRWKSGAAKARRLDLASSSQQNLASREEQQLRLTDTWPLRFSMELAPVAPRITGALCGCLPASQGWMDLKLTSSRRSWCCQPTGKLTLSAVAVLALKALKGSGMDPKTLAGRKRQGSRRAPCVGTRAIHGVKMRLPPGSAVYLTGRH